MSNSISFSGGCQCGAVRYRIDGYLTDPHICHCRMCQKAAGNYFMPLAKAHRNDFNLSRGEASWFRSSGPIRRGFCQKCGTPLFFETIGHSHVYITLGSLDEPARVEPVIQHGVEAKMPWFGHLEHMPGEATELNEELDGVRLADITATKRQHPDHDTEHWQLKDNTDD